jgi:filamentous hemagglutinin family protein
MKTALFFTLPLSLFTFSAAAQEASIAPDGTLPTEVNSSGNLTEITGGAQAGGNLFHSFSNFSVPTGGEAFFNNAADINNIISRVTGGKISSIDGLIRANGSANLFLINPAGIVFGSNASLNIGGSFLGSTADSLAFPEGEFSATNIQKPLLTINAPIGLNFRDNPEPIVHQSRATNSDGQLIGFQTLSEKNISLVGGDISLDGGIVFAPEAKVNLGGLSAAGQVKFNENGSLIFPDGVARGNVSLTNGALATVTGERGGDINITASNIQINGNSGLLGGTFESIGSPDSQSGDINLNATGTINLDTSPEGVDTIDNEAQIGNAGNINIFTGSLNLSNGAVVSSSTSGKGNAGSIKINASDTISVKGSNDGIFSTIVSEVKSTGKGNAGGIDITTKNLSVTNGGFISSGTFGEGSANNIKINASDTIAVDGRNNLNFSSISSQVNLNGKGDAGGVDITTKNLSVTNGGFISASIFGEGNAGNVKINANDTISVDGSTSIIASQVESTGKGDAGGIDITTKNLSVTNGGQISSGTFGQGNGGNLTINAEQLSVKNDAAVKADTNGEGNAGNLSLNVQNLVVNGSQISASTFGKGDAGNLTVNASKSVELTGEIPGKDGLNGPSGFPGGLFAQVDLNGKGQGGKLTVETESLSISNGSKIQAATFGEGNAGDLTIRASKIDVFDTPDANNYFATTINAGVSLDPRNVDLAKGNGGNLTIEADRLSIRNGASVTADTNGEGNAGNLSIDVKNLAVQNSQVSSSTFGKGNAGNLTVNASESIELSGESLNGNGQPIGPGGLLAQVDLNGEGQGGNLTVETKRLSISNGSKIQAATFNNGDAGEINIRASRIDLFNTPNANNKFSTEISAGSIRDVLGRNADSPLTGNGGSINIETDRLTLKNGTRINVRADGQGNSGNININSPNGFIVAFPNQNNDILATSQARSGGQININVQSIYGFDKKNIQSITDIQSLLTNRENDINSTSGQPGLDGSVNLNTQTLDPAKKTVQSSQNVVEPDTTVAQACDAEGTGGVSNSFTITGRGGMPADPTKPLNSSILAGVSKTEEQRGEGAEEQRSGGVQEQGGQVEAIDSDGKKKIFSFDEIIPARGVAINEKGQVVLTRYPTPNASDSLRDSDASRSLPSSNYCSAYSTPENLLATDIENNQTEETLDDKTVEELMNFLYSMSSKKEKT